MVRFLRPLRWWPGTGYARAALRAQPCPACISRNPHPATARLDWIEQRPVALLKHVALREWRAQLESERAQHAVVAVVALQDDADERRRRSATGGAELRRDRIAFGQFE